ncbi:MAG TPA: hypothetical protein VIM22_00090 [Solirubrobacteraceae bacterium]
MFGTRRQYFLCNRATGRRFKLLARATPRLVRRAGNYLVYARNDSPRRACDIGNPCSADAESRNIRTGRLRASLFVASPDGVPRFRKLVVRAKTGHVGAAADDGSGSVKVFVATGAGVFDDVDDDPGIAARSLRLRGTTLSWKRLGVKVSSRLR